FRISEGNRGAASPRFSAQSGCICYKDYRCLACCKSLYVRSGQTVTWGATGVKKPAFSSNLLERPSLYIGLWIVLLSGIPYFPFLAVPFLPDDYLQITLARELGPVSHWLHLLDDPLFRNRATSIVMTYWTDWLFPLSPLACGISSILLHALNGLLVYGLGAARSIGWRLSALTAIMFAVQERHHEAIVWYAALPELLVFMFVLTTLLLWLL